MLGLVHAHLRETQLALGKRIAYGRLSEIAGRCAWKLDHTLRIIDFPAASEAVIARMPATSREWMQRFVDGLNWYQEHAGPVPFAYRLLGMRREQWTIRDLLAIGRVAGADISWSTYFSLIGHRGADGWPELWRRALRTGVTPTFSFDAATRGAAFANLLFGYGRSGSNCVVVSPARSASGGALLASDPHLPLLLPNLWLLAGVRSPLYRVVGLMPAGLPIFGLGRSETLAWGGTNMRAASSDLFDVAGKPIESRTERLRTRFWKSREVIVTLLGSGAADLGFAAVQRRAGRKRRAALDGPPAERRDHCIPRRAARDHPRGLPRRLRQLRGRGPEHAVRRQERQYRPGHGGVAAGAQIRGAPGPRAGWRGSRAALARLPERDAASLVAQSGQGFFAYGNNPPAQIDTPISLFPLAPERVERIQALLRAKDTFSVADLRAMQRDVVSTAALALKEGRVRALDEAGVAVRRPGFVACLRGWARACTRRTRLGRSRSRRCCITSRAGWSTLTPLPMRAD